MKLLIRPRGQASVWRAKLLLSRYGQTTSFPARSPAGVSPSQVRSVATVQKELNNGQGSHDEDSTRSDQADHVVLSPSKTVMENENNSSQDYGSVACRPKDGRSVSTI